MATVIESLDTLRDIVNIFGTNRPDGNLPEHSWTYNITNLVLTPPKLTIEFRQHMGTLDPDIVRTVSSNGVLRIKTKD